MPIPAAVENGSGAACVRTGPELLCNNWGLLFGERMAPSGWAGMALCAVGVALVLRANA